MKPETTTAQEQPSPEQTQAYTDVERSADQAGGSVTDIDHAGSYRGGQSATERDASSPLDGTIAQTSPTVNPLSRTAPVSNLDVLPAVAPVNDAGMFVTAAGAPAATTLARAQGGRPIVPGYELLEVVGKGGMGVVYRAKQISLEREIALKFLRDDFHAKSATGLRFLEEARITAQLQHPGIPAVHEVGYLSDGRPYLAMKLIKGRTLDNLLKEQGPGSTKWLAVFEAVCQAVGYAHQHGVIHRDLKPSNVMVGAFGEVQVMDWGLAKVLGKNTKYGHLGDDEKPESDSTGELDTIHHNESLQTRAGSFLGTPAFMAPEQASGALKLLSARTDVFGLGAVLCTLLTGKPPYLGSNAETTRLMAASTRQDEAIERLNACGADPDLIDLCKRCMAPDPKLRPADGTVVARQVASLRSYAEERAKQAELQTARAEVEIAEQRKRRRLQLYAGSSLLTVIAAGLITSLAYYFKAEHQRGIAVEQKQIAEENEIRASQNAEIARKNQLQAEANERLAIANQQRAERQSAIATSTLKFFLEDLLRQADVTVQANTIRHADTAFEIKENPTIRELLDRAAAELSPDRIEKKFPRQLPAQARILTTVGKTYQGIGEYAKAIEFLLRAEATWFRGHGPDLLKAPLGKLPSGELIPTEDQRDLLEVQSNLARAYASIGQQEKSLQLMEQIDAANRRLYHATSGLEHGTILNGMVNLALAYDSNGKTKEAIALLEKATEEFRKKWGDEHEQTLAAKHFLGSIKLNDPTRLLSATRLLEETWAGRKQILGPEHPDTLRTANNLAVAYSQESQNAETKAKGLQLFREVRDGQIRTLGADHPDTLLTSNCFALGLRRAGQAEDAVKHFTDLKKACIRKLGDEHDTTLKVMDNLAESLAESQRFAEAIDEYEKVYAIRSRVRGAEHADTVLTLNNLADTYLMSGAVGKALPLFEEVYSIECRKHRGDHEDKITAANGLAEALWRDNQKPRALSLWREAARGITRLQYSHPMSSVILTNLALNLESQGEYADAERWRREALLCMKQREQNETKEYAYELNQLGRNLMRQRKWNDAAREIRAAMELREKLLPGGWVPLATRSLLGEALAGAGQNAEAEQCLVQGFEGLRKMTDRIPPEFRVEIRNAGYRLLAFYLKTQQVDKAAALKTQLPIEKAPRPRAVK